MSILELVLPTADVVDVRQFCARESISSLFSVELVVMSANQSIDLDAVVGRPCRFTVQANVELGIPAPRFWSGICSELEQVRSVTRAVGKLATYQLTIVPELWLATQRRNYRIFQQMSEVDAALELLGEWGVEPLVHLDRAKYKKRKYRVQYAESDYAFISRMLEEAGVSFFFTQKDGRNVLVLTDRPQSAEPRKLRIPFRDEPSALEGKETGVYHVQVGRQVRPGRYTMRDHDYRMAPDYLLVASSAGDDATETEASLESYDYTPGAFLYEVDRGDDTPVADDKSRVRTDEAEAANLAKKRMDGTRTTAHLVAFDTNAADVAAGSVLGFLDHPHRSLGDDQHLLVLRSRMSGFDTGAIEISCEALNAKFAYRPPLTTPRPQVRGVESATVVGAPGDEIHTDEFGRVRVHFHWDRRSTRDDTSSCWIHVSQGWAGTGYGSIALPRVGQEVLVEFLGGDPDRPVITGRLFTNTEKVPYKLPDNKTVTVVTKTNSTGNTGGFNEIKAEDRAGQELLYVRAERDLETLVRREERRTVGVDRTTTVGHDDVLDVKHDRRTIVGGVEERTFTSPKPGAPRTVQTNTNSLNKLEVGGTLVEVTPDGVLIKGTKIRLECTTFEVQTDDATINSLTTMLHSMNLTKVVGKPIMIDSVTDVDIRSGALIKLNCE